MASGRSVSRDTRKAIVWLFRFITAAAVVGCWAAFSASHTGQNYDYALYSALVEFRGPLPFPDDVVVVALDEDTYSAWELPMDRPIPRERYAKVVRKLAELGASRVVFDVVFAGRSQSPEGDTELRNALGALPTFLGVDNGVVPGTGGITYHQMFKPDPYISKFAAGLVLVNHVLDGNEARRFYNMHTENTEDFVMLSEAGAGITKPSDRAKVTLPRPWDYVKYYGKGDVITSYSMYQITEESVDFPFPAELVKGKVVYIGLALRTGLGTDQKDAFGTPFGSIFGVKIHATQAANILHQEWIRRLDPDQELRLMGGLLFFCALWILILKPTQSVTATITFVSGWFVLAYWSLKMDFALSGGSAITVGLPSACLFNVLYWYVRTRKRQVQIERAFSHYLSPAMVTQLKRDPSALKLGGAEIFATAMFTDIAAFTTMSEQLGAVRVTAMLNAYFSEVSAVIMEEGGTVIKFIGDAVFALWNAPLRQEDHAIRAIRTSLKIQEICKRFNERGEFPPLVTRVGINSGTMVVGNLGSEKRFDFTAIGDPVNLASRVEGVNKYFGSTVLVTQDTVDLAGQELDTLLMGSVRVVGKEQPVKLYRLDVAALPPAVRAQWQQALQLFTQRDFDAARKTFEALIAEGSDLSGAASFYLEEFDDMDISQLDAGWAGEITLDHK